MDSSFIQLPPHEAIRYLQQKGYKLTFDYDEMLHEAHHKAFTVAKVTRLDLLSDIHASLQDALKEGKPFAQWQKEIRPTLARKGWLGDVEAVNPRTGEVKQIHVGSRRLRTIYYTNMRVAYMAGKAKSLYERETVQYLRYIAILDKRTRPLHRAMHGKVLPKDHPWWQTNFPPNGWNCRCRVAAVRGSQVERYAKDGMLIERDQTPSDIASADWAYDVRTGTLPQLRAYAKQRISKAPKTIAAATTEAMKQEDYIVRKKQLEEMVREVIEKDNQRYPIRAIEIGALSDEIIDAFEEITGIQTEAKGIVLEKNRLLHASPRRKEAYNQALRVEEFYEIVDVIQEDRDVYIDTRAKNIIYVFDDEKDKSKINKIVIEPNKNIKKFGKINATVTLSKVSRHNIEEKHIKKAR